MKYILQISDNNNRKEIELKRSEVADGIGERRLSQIENDIEEENAWLPVDKFNVVMAKIKRLKRDGWEIPKLVACVYDLFQDYLISEAQEEVLYIIADPFEKYNEPSEYWREMDYANPLREAIEKEG